MKRRRVLRPPSSSHLCRRDLRGGDGRFQLRRRLGPQSLASSRRLLTRYVGARVVFIDSPHHR